MRLPDPVDDHASHQRVFRARSASEPARACGPVVLADGRGRIGLPGGQDGGHARLDGGARPGRVAALEDVGQRGLRPLFRPDVGVRRGRGPGRVDRGDPIVQAA